MRKKRRSFVRTELIGCRRRPWRKRAECRRGRPPPRAATGTPRVQGGRGETGRRSRSSPLRPRGRTAWSPRCRLQPERKHELKHDHGQDVCPCIPSLTTQVMSTSSIVIVRLTITYWLHASWERVVLGSCASQEDGVSCGSLKILPWSHFFPPLLRPS